MKTCDSHVNEEVKFVTQLKKPWMIEVATIEVAMDHWRTIEVAIIEVATDHWSNHDWSIHRHDWTTQDDWSSHRPLK